MTPTRLMIADDHPLVRAGLRTLLQHRSDVDIVAEAGDGEDAVRLTRLHKPDVLLLDISMPKMSGLDVAAQISKDLPATRIVMLSVHANDAYVRRALRAGAAGYLLKDADAEELHAAIAAVMHGGTYLSPSVSKYLLSIPAHAGRTDSSLYGTLTPRQREVLQLIAEGHSTREIARKLTLSVKTVETHRADLMVRLDIADIAGLVRYAIRTGLVHLDS